MTCRPFQPLTPISPGSARLSGWTPRFPMPRIAAAWRAFSLTFLITQRDAVDRHRPGQAFGLVQRDWSAGDRRRAAGGAARAAITRRAPAEGECALVGRTPRSTVTAACPVPAPAGGHRSPQRICPRRARLIPADCRPLDRHPCLVAQPLIKAAQQGTTAGQGDTAVHDVAGQLGRALVRAWP